MPEDKYGEGAGGGFKGETLPLQLQQQIAASGLTPAEWWARMQAIAALIPPGYEQIDATHWYDPAANQIYELRGTADKPTLAGFTAAETKSYLNTLGVGGGGGGGGGGVGQDPRYWQLQYDQLAAQYANMGLDAESARRQALATLIANRNNTQLGIANTSAGIAKTAADYAAHPSDPYAESIYRTTVGGSTPFGDINNSAFGEYGKTLAEKGASIFGPVWEDLQKAREYAGQWPQPDFVNPVQTPPGFAKGGQIDIDGMAKSRSMDGYSPASSEGGTNLNIHERAVVVGESGHVYATLGERREDGSPRAEQLIIKPLKSEMEKDKQLKMAGKAMTETQGQTMKSFAGGGSAYVTPTPDDLIEQFRKELRRLTGPYEDPFGGARFLAGAPANAIQSDPHLRDITESTYDIKGIRPAQLWADVAKFTPNAPSYQRQIVF